MIQPATFLLPYQAWGSLPLGHCMLLNQRGAGWGHGTHTRPSQSCSRHYQTCYVSGKPRSICLPGHLPQDPGSLRADDFNHSILGSLSQLNKESGTGNVFLLLSVQSWLSVSYSTQTPFKGKLELRQCPWARVQLAGSLCFPPVASSLSTHTHSLEASLCALTPSDQISSCPLSPFELGVTRSSHSPSHSSSPGLLSPHVLCHLVRERVPAHWTFRFQPFSLVLLCFIFLNYYLL